MLPLLAGRAAAEAKGAGMIYQLRVYEIFEANKAAFHDRFERHAMRIMKTHGFDIVETFEARSTGRTEFVYLLRWPDEAALRARWAAFMADAEWARIKQESAAVHGRLVGAIEERILQPTGYSPGGLAGIA
ncbi:MAG: NIPSNAP family protein [Sphingobium sp.]